MCVCVGGSGLGMLHSTGRIINSNGFLETAVVKMTVGTELSLLIEMMS